MALIYAVDGKTPQIGQDCFLAPTAVLIGDVRVGDRANIWFGTVLRGDKSYIEIGAGCSVQDNTVIHCADDLPTIVRDDVLIGHGALLEGCIIEPHALIGMGAIVLQRAHVGAHAMIAAGAVVGEGVRIGEKMLAAGVPAREKKELQGSSLRWTSTGVEEYQKLRELYLRTGEELA